MGRFYDGPYAAQLGYGHEGYAAQIRPDGTTSDCSTTEFERYLAACDCGWTGTGRYPATEEGWERALQEWETEHLQPQITAARSQWPIWAARLGASAGHAAELIIHDRSYDAVAVLSRMANSLATWTRTAEMLAEATAETDHDDQSVWEVS